MSFNIRENGTSYCLMRSPYRPLNFPNNNSSVPGRIPVPETVNECKYVYFFPFVIKCVSIIIILLNLEYNMNNLTPLSATELHSHNI